MKKLILIGLLGFGTFGYSTAQYPRHLSTSHKEYHEMAHHDWGYDEDFRVSRNSNSRKIDSFQRQAYWKIENGREKGHISRNSYHNLKRVFSQIETKENRFMRNGRLTKEETRILQSDLAHLDRMIHQETRGSIRQKF